MDLNKEEFDQIFEIFRIECEEHIQNLNRALISLEEDPDQADLIEEIFREAHSLKGAARMINFKTIEGIAHHMETILGKIKNNELELSPKISDLILKGLDTIEGIVENISEGGEESDEDTSKILKQLTQVSKETIAVQEEKDIKTSKTKQQKKQKIKNDLSLFSEETHDAHKILIDSLNEIKKNPNNLEEIKNVFEQSYALKGSARIVKHLEMGDLSFSMEKCFQALLNSEDRITSARVNLFIKAASLLKTFITHIEKEKRIKPPVEYQQIVSEIDRFTKEVTLAQSKNSPQTKKKRESRISPVDDKKTLSKTSESEKVLKKKKIPLSKTMKSSVRVSSDKLDSLMGQAGELLIMKLKARQRLADTQSIINDYSGMSRDVKSKMIEFNKANRHPDDHLDAHKRDGQNSLLLELGGNLSQISDRLEFLHKSLFDDFRQFSIIIERLQDDVRKTRLFPFQRVLDPFPRMVRDLAISVDKKVKLEVSGGAIELDKYILEQIKDPMMHIIRNCIDHGIELPKDRIKLKKSEAGLVKIEATQKGNNAVIRVSDDGKGIHLENIMQSAIEKSLYTQEDISKMKEKQILNLIFHPGFSTSDIVTDISGRGVGMDVVKANIERLNGTIDIETESEKGSIFTMIIPLTLSTTQSLKISATGETFFLPVDMVERIIKVVEHDLPIVEGYPAIHYSGSYIPYVRLSSVLELSEDDANHRFIQKRPVAILKTGNMLAAFGMDDFLGEEEIVMKGLGPYMKRIRNISGVTIMREGTIAPVLNVTDMINTVHLRGISQIKVRVEKKKSIRGVSVLVVDDSVMTRTLTKNIIESYGYRVTIAVDGQDALSKLQGENFDIIVSDVQMPSMDGLEFTERVKQDERYRNIPVILMSALESSEDKKRGIEMGADAYIVKSSFEQTNLMNTIKRLIG